MRDPSVLDSLRLSSEQNLLKKVVEARRFCETVAKQDDTTSGNLRHLSHRNDLVIATIGFALALTDYTGNTDRLEKILRWLLGSITKLYSEAFKGLNNRRAFVSGALMGSFGSVFPALGITFYCLDCLGYLRIQSVSEVSDLRFWAMFFVLLTPSMIIAILAMTVVAYALVNLPLLLLRILISLATVLCYPKRGVVGTIGLLLASIDLSLYYFGVFVR